VRIEIASFVIAVAMCGTQTSAQNVSAVPQFQVDPFWPKPLPNNWILGQVSGIATDRYDRIWVVHRPASLTVRKRAAEQNPPEAKCCVAAPPVLVFDQSGNLIRYWRGARPGYQWPESEHGVFIDDDDFVWLTRRQIRQILGTPDNTMQVRIDNLFCLLNNGFLRALFKIGSIFG
jgi:hypothetical protein